MQNATDGGCKSQEHGHGQTAINSSVHRQLQIYNSLPIVQNIGETPALSDEELRNGQLNPAMHTVDVSPHLYYYQQPESQTNESWCHFGSNPNFSNRLVENLSELSVSHSRSPPQQQIHRFLCPVQFLPSAGSPEKKMQKPAPCNPFSGPLSETWNSYQKGEAVPQTVPLMQSPRPLCGYDSDGQQIACRICQDETSQERLVSPCFCSGTVGYVHVSCLNTWLQATSRTTCELCAYPFPVTKRPASLREYLRNPRANMDLPNLVCDVAFLAVLTPLLLSSVYLSSTGAIKYESLGQAGSMCAVITLLLALLLVYISWACLAVFYHVRVWRAWRDRHGIVSKLNEGLIAHKPVQKKLPDSGTNHIIPIQRLEVESGGDAVRAKEALHMKDSGAKSPSNSSTTADTAILLTPMNRASSWIKMNNRICVTSNN